MRAQASIIACRQSTPALPICVFVTRAALTINLAPQIVWLMMCHTSQWLWQSKNQWIKPGHCPSRAQNEYIVHYYIRKGTEADHCTFTLTDRQRSYHIRKIANIQLAHGALPERKFGLGVRKMVLTADQFCLEIWLVILIMKIASSSHRPTLIFITFYQIKLIHKILSRFI